MARNLNLITKNEILEISVENANLIQRKINEINEYLNQEFLNDVTLLIEMFYNAAPYDQEIIEKRSTRVIELFELFEVDSVVFDVIQALSLGYQHHTPHVTTKQMSEELGISNQALHRYLYDVTDEEQVKEARIKKHPMIPVQKYVRIVVMAQRLDFERFKEWFMLKRGGRE